MTFNKTTNYFLSQYSADEKPKWAGTNIPPNCVPESGNYNGDMMIIDGAFTKVKKLIDSFSDSVIFNKESFADNSMKTNYFSTKLVDRISIDKFNLVDFQIDGKKLQDNTLATKQIPPGSLPADFFEPNLFTVDTIKENSLRPSVVKQPNITTSKDIIIVSELEDKIPESKINFPTESVLTVPNKVVLLFVDKTTRISVSNFPIDYTSLNLVPSAKSYTFVNPIAGQPNPTPSQLGLRYYKKQGGA